MDTEPPSDFKSIFAKFEVDGRSKTLPANSTPKPNISNVRSNPALLGVINSLENKPKLIPPPIAQKPDVPAKPRPAPGNKPPLPSKERLSSLKDDMRLNKGLRHTLYITDSTRSNGDGVCSKSPQVYRQSWSASMDTKFPPLPNQSDSLDCYEVIDDSFKTTQKPKLPLKGHLKPHVLNLSQPKPSQALETNQSDTQDFYEVVDDTLKAPAKPPLNFLAGLKSKVSAFSEHKPSPAMESRQSETLDCYEVVNDPPKVSQRPPSHYTTKSSYSEHKPSPTTESRQSETLECYEVVNDLPMISQRPPSGTQSYFSEMKDVAGLEECYEEVESTIHAPAERPSPVGGNSKHRLPFPDPLPIPDINEIDRQDNYEDADIIFIAPPPPFNDLPTSQNNSPSMKTNLQPSWKTTSSDGRPNKEDKPPRPPDAKNKPKPNIPANNTPRKKPLPSIESLGLPPPKEPRPPQVDLTPYRSCAVVVPGPPKETAETEYELPAPSSPSHEEDCYDDTMNLGALQEGESNIYEVEEMRSETPRIPEYKPSLPSPSPEGGRECYDDIATLGASAADCNLYEVEESEFAPELARQSFCEVPEENIDLRWNLNADRTTLPRSDSKDGKISKKEQAFRKKFMITGLEDALYTTTIILDFKPEKYTLPVKKGDMVDVIRITDCPTGKWLVKDSQGNYGFVPVSCVDISKDILSFSNQHLLTTSAPPSDIYTEVERMYDSGTGTDLSVTSDSYSVKSDDAYDDIDNKTSTLNNSGGKSKGFGNLFRKDRNKREELGTPTVTGSLGGTSEEGGEYSSIGESNSREKEDKSSTWRSLFQKAKGKTESLKNEGKGNTPVSTKKLTKEEKTFREKFKYTGEINVFSVATISDPAPLSPKSKMDLPVKPGETVDVIDVTNEDQIICRNAEGKFGYVGIEFLNFQSNY